MNQQFIDENFCNAEISALLKEVGFNEPCLAYYRRGETFNVLHPNQTMSNTDLNAAILNSTSVAAPLYQQAIKWVNYRLFDNNFSMMTTTHVQPNEIAKSLKAAISILKSNQSKQQ